jgi:hypothetical protein
MGIKVIVISISVLVAINFVFKGGRETLLSCRPFVSDGTNWYGSYTQGYTP